MRIRISFRKFIILLLLTILSVWIWVFLTNESPVFTHTCNQTELFQSQLHQLVERVHEVLVRLELTHFLCYGALWGQIRLARTLPWVNKAEFCLLNEQLVTKDEVLMIRIFRSHDLNLQYDWNDGQYIVTANNLKPVVVLVVFELDSVVGMYRRVGLKRRLLPPDCEHITSLDCFPPRLAQPPLPLKQFGRASLPVPREQIELQKYHYRDSWWKETVEFNC